MWDQPLYEPNYAETFLTEHQNSQNLAFGREHNKLSLEGLDNAKPACCPPSTCPCSMTFSGFSLHFLGCSL